MAKPPKCTICKEPYQKFNSTQKVCSVKCAIELAKIEAGNKKKAEIKEVRKWQKVEKEKLKTSKDYVQDLQKLVNSYVRERDKFKTCVTCNSKLSNIKYDAGHYYSAGGHPSVRFDLRNIHGQCVHCNRDKHGNLIVYSQKILTRITQEDFEDLTKLSKTTRKYTISELKDLIKQFKQMLKEVKKVNDDLQN